MPTPAPIAVRHAVITALVVAATIAAPRSTAAQIDLWAPAGQIHTIKNQLVAAVAQLAEALAGAYGDEGPRVSSAIESIDRVRNQWDQAIRAYEALLAGMTDSAEVHVARGTVYLDRYRIDDALREFAAAARLDARRPDLYSLSALAYDLSHRHQEAAQALTDASSRDDGNPLTVYRLAQQLIKGGRREDATEALRRFEELQRKRAIQPGSASPTPSPFERANLFRQAPGVAPIFPPHRYRPAFALLIGGNYEQAVIELKRAAIGDPLLVQPAARKAIADAGALLRRGQLSLAVSALEAAAAVPPDLSEIHRLLGVAYWADGREEKSLEQLTTAIRLSPDDERARLALADVLVAAGRHAEAERTLEDTLRTIPDSGPAHYRLGQLYQILSLLPQAARELNTAAALEPLVGLDRLYDTIGGLYANQADFDLAVDAYAQRVDVNPNHADGHRKLGEIYFLQGRDDEALAEFVAALLIDPSNSAALAAASQVYVRMGRYAEALTASRQALTLDAGHNEARYALATSLIRLGQAEEGRTELQIFQRAQAAAMANAQRQSALKVTWREAERRLERGEYADAATLLRQALADDPDHPEGQRRLGSALLKSGQYGAAIQALGQAQRQEDSAEIHQWLAEAYKGLGQAGDSEEQTALAAQARERERVERLRKIAGGR